jgi:hypothetical protein
LIERAEWQRQRRQIHVDPILGREATA